MPTVLVVDDSAVDRQVIGGLLGTDGDLDILYAVDGAQGLDVIRSVSPDLVVTDLMMPEVDGLTLVKTVRSECPTTPVILVTSQGSEETAVRALQEGAASYVPKHRLAHTLLETVRGVLAVSTKPRPKCQRQTRLTIKRAVSGLSSAEIHSASASRPL